MGRPAACKVRPYSKDDDDDDKALSEPKLVLVPLLLTLAYRHSRHMHAHRKRKLYLLGATSLCTIILSHDCRRAKGSRRR